MGMTNRGFKIPLLSLLGLLLSCYRKEGEREEGEEVEEEENGCLFKSIRKKDMHTRSHCLKKC